MTDHLHKNSVLVLNKNWQAVGVKTPAETFCMLSAGTATPLDIHGDEHINKVTWEEWMKLPIRETDQVVKTSRGDIRIPTVVVAANYNQVPLHRPRFTARGIWERDGGICQYTGKKLKIGEGNIDHVVPRSRGGAHSWENCVLSHRGVNSKKGAKLITEAGLKLIKLPGKPQPIPAPVAIRRMVAHQENVAPDWIKFLG